MDDLNGNYVISQLLQIALGGDFMGLISFLQQDLPG